MIITYANTTGVWRMAESTVQRWEDVIPGWRGPDYRPLAIEYDPSVAAGPVAGAIISSVESVDWDGDGGRDLLVSSWDACYEGVVRLFLDTGTTTDGTPKFVSGPIVGGVSGYAHAVVENGEIGLLTTSRLRPTLHLFRNQGARGTPRFAEPIEILLDAAWLHEGELLHRAIYADIDGDGTAELIVGTDYWGDYWPDGIEWFQAEYNPYTPEGRWRGGPLRGHLYVFRNKGTRLEPNFEKGEPLYAGDRPIEVYGMAAPAFADFSGDGHLDLICGDFLDRLHFYPGFGNGRFGPGQYVRDSRGGELVLPHCVHFPFPVSWSGLSDLLVAAEDGGVSFLRDSGRLSDGIPAFADPVSLEAAKAPIHAGIVPVPAAADWTGNGTSDLVVGNSAGALLFLPNLGESGSPRFGREELLNAGGRPINIRAGSPGSLQGPAETKFGYTCPVAVDWDGDGIPDLLTSSVHGDHLLLRCIRRGDPPEFAAPVPLTYQGKPLRTVWRVRPAVVDWLGDGSLSYVCLDENGVLASYRRETDTVLTDKRFLCFEDDLPIRFTEDFGGGLGRIKLCLCDWAGEGRYDLIVGTHSRASVPPRSGGAPRHTTGQAAVLMLRNVGNNEAPEFACPKPFCFRGEPIQLGMHACAPETVDWRNRGLPDLIVGAEDGSLLWFKREDLSW